MDKYKNYIIDALDKNGIIYVLKTYHDIINLYKLGKTKKFKEIIHHIDNIYETNYIDEYYQQNNIKKELIQSYDKTSLKVRKSNKNIKQNGGYFIITIYVL